MTQGASGHRTAVINQIRGFLLEHGITVCVRMNFMSGPNYPGAGGSWDYRKTTPCKVSNLSYFK